MAISHESMTILMGLYLSNEKTADIPQNMQEKNSACWSLAAADHIYHVGKGYDFTERYELTDIGQLYVERSAGDIGHITDTAVMMLYRAVNGGRSGYPLPYAMRNDIKHVFQLAVFGFISWDITMIFNKGSRIRFDGYIKPTKKGKNAVKKDGILFPQLQAVLVSKNSYALTTAVCTLTTHLTGLLDALERLETAVEISEAENDLICSMPLAQTTQAAADIARATAVFSLKGETSKQAAVFTLEKFLEHASPSLRDKLAIRMTKLYDESEAEND